MGFALGRLARDVHIVRRRRQPHFTDDHDHDCGRDYDYDRGPDDNHHGPVDLHNDVGTGADDDHDDAVAGRLRHAGPSDLGQPGLLCLELSLERRSNAQL